MAEGSCMYKKKNYSWSGGVERAGDKENIARPLCHSMLLLFNIIVVNDHVLAHSLDRIAS